MRISDWSSDVCSSDLRSGRPAIANLRQRGATHRTCDNLSSQRRQKLAETRHPRSGRTAIANLRQRGAIHRTCDNLSSQRRQKLAETRHPRSGRTAIARSEEHTSELQSLMRNSYAVSCLKKKTNTPK